MLQDIAPHILNNQYKPEKPKENSYILCYTKDKVLVNINEDGTFTLPTLSDLSKGNSQIEKGCTYLFSIDNHQYFLLDKTEEQLVFGDEYELKKVRSIMNR